MVEMLGVLAIIGVLSIGGIAAYRYAMDKHKANEFMYNLELSIVNVQGVLAQKQNSKIIGQILGNGDIKCWCAASYAVKDFSAYAGNVGYTSMGAGGDDEQCQNTFPNAQCGNSIDVNVSFQEPESWMKLIKSSDYSFNGSERSRCFSSSNPETLYDLVKECNDVGFLFIQ